MTSYLIPTRKTHLFLTVHAQCPQLSPEAKPHLPTITGGLSLNKSCGGDKP